MLFNGIDMSDHMRIIDVRGRGLTEQELTTVRPIGSSKDYVTYRTKPKRFLEVDYEIRAKDKESLRKKIDDVSALIETEGEVPVIFKDESDRTYYCEYAGAEENTEYHHIGIHRGTIILMRDQHKYGPERNLILPADISEVTNNGTAESDPIFELTATQKSTFAMVSNNDGEYNLIGKPAEVEEELVDEKTLLVDERGDTLDTWTTSGTKVDGTVSGQLVPDGTGIVVSDYGTGERWHGPALLKEINPIQDFEVEMRLRVDSSNPRQTYRIELYLFDEFMNELGKMAIVDNSSSRMQFAAEGRYGPFVGVGVNYPIYSRNYSRQDRHFHGMLRMRRIGQRFEFYVARIGVIDEFTHHDTFNQFFHDVNNEYQGRLKYVQMHIGKFAGTESANLPRINAFKVYEHNEVTVDQTPYIFFPGDVITFDHKDNDILINGEPRMDLKNFGGSFFKLKKGTNRLIITPENSFDAKVKYRERYK